VSESSESGLSWTFLPAASLLSKLASDSVSDSLGPPVAPSLPTRSSAASPLSKLLAGLGLGSPNSSLVSAGFPTPVDSVPVTSAVCPSP
jgi:hypothetical protein